MVMVAVIAFCGFFASSCTRVYDGDADLPVGVTERISAATGGTLTTANGLRLVIPAGALAGDTDVTLTPVALRDPDGRAIIAARLSPNGLILLRPATLTMPLPRDWPADDEPVRLDFEGDDPEDAVEAHDPPTLLVAATGATPTVELPIHHFSGVVCARNCHAGTIRYLLARLEERGCRREDVIDFVRSRYPGLDIPADGCGARGAQVVQAYLDSVFDDVAAYDEGEPISAAAVDDLITTAESGKLVVVAFKGGAWGARGGPRGFFPSGAMDYRHTAAFEKVGGVWQLRNSLATANRGLIDALGGNTLHYPALGLEAFRHLRQGEAVEQQLCGATDCLSAPHLNPYGLDVYNPVDGSPPRSVPWTAIRIYVERAEALADVDCRPGDLPLAFPRTYAGTGTVVRSLTINWDGGSSASCEGSGAFTATLGADGTIILQGEIDQPPTFDSTGAYCRSGTETFFRRGTHGADMFAIEIPYESTSTTMVGSYSASQLTGSYEVSWSGVVAGFGPDGLTKSDRVSMTLTRQP